MKYRWMEKLPTLIRDMVILCLGIFVVGTLFNAFYPKGYKLVSWVDHKRVTEGGTREETGAHVRIEGIPTEVTLEEAYTLFEQGHVVFDARERAVYDLLRIARAKHLSISDYPDMKEEYPDVLGGTNAVLTYCIDRECPLSHKLARKILEDYPKMTVYVIVDGLAGWTNAGYPTEEGGR